jgi:branched-chain amino acid transport system ATP-binding protein
VIQSTHHDATSSRPHERAAAVALAAEDVKVHFGGVKAVDGVSLCLARGEILGLIGPNGAGKTTLVNALTGMAPLTAGRVLLDANDVSKATADQLARLGIARTFQAARLFKALTVVENVEVAGLGIGRKRRDALQTAHELIERLGLRERAHARADALPYGAERLLSIARALALAPTFLLLDEPAAGLGSVETERLMETIKAIRDDYGCGVLVIEHDMRLIMGVCERIQVLDHGKTLAIGDPTEVRANPHVVAAYLGHDAAARAGDA